MTTEPENKKGKVPFKSPLYMVGFSIMIFGTSFLGSAIARQIQNTVVGRHYYDWMAIGATVAVVGVVIIINSRRRTPKA